MFSSRSSFAPEVGSRIRAGELGGYYIDFDFKATSPDWPPPWLRAREQQLHVASAQWALGCYERYLKGEGDRWLAGAIGAAEHLVSDQRVGGTLDGGWIHRFAMPHTYRLRPPWLSAMAQGEGASILVRVHRETGDDRFAEAALRALKPMVAPVAEGGLRAELGSGPFFEEYPTDPPSLVLNGGIYALWGAYDVGVALGDRSAAAEFEAGVRALAEEIHRFDSGYWSLYDLYPHPLPNVASSAYHGLHITQLCAMQRIAPHPEFEATIARFRGYQASRAKRSRAFAMKVAFRLAVPRNGLLAHRMPWAPSESTREI